MGATKNDYSNIRFFDLKLKDKEDNTVAWFYEREKNEDGNIVTVDQFNSLEGFIVKIDHLEIEWGNNNDSMTKFRIHLFDPKDGKIYMMAMGLSSIFRSIVNSLYSVKEKFGWVVIRVWVGKSGYPGVTVTNDGKETKWAIDWDKQSKYIKKISKGGKEEKDYYDLDMRFMEIAENEVMNIVHKSYNITTLTAGLPVSEKPSEQAEEETSKKTSADPNTIHVDDIKNPSMAPDQPKPADGFTEETVEDDLPF